MMSALKKEIQLQVYYDAACPICLREMQWLMSKNTANRVSFTAIQSLPHGVAERSVDDLMAEMHARLPDGTWVQGVEVFRKLYQRLDMGWWVPMSRLPVISRLLDAVYHVFAKHRLRLVGRCERSGCALPEAQQGIAA